MNVSDRAARALASSEAGPPRGAGLPTGHELVERLLSSPLASLPGLADRVRLASRVVAVGRQGLLKHEEIGSDGRSRRPFRLLVAGGEGEERDEQDDGCAARPGEAIRWCGLERAEVSDHLG